MGYVFDFNDAKAYDRSQEHRTSRFLVDMEKRLLFDLLEPVPGKTALDVGCGTGASLRPLIEAGLRATGLDPSPYMLDIAAQKFGRHVDFHRGVAEDLPFEDNSFNYVCLVTTLEFVDDPLKALEEACRVARNKVFIGVMNRYAVRGFHLRIKGIFTKSFYNHAHFYSVWELKRMLRGLLGEVPISWRTICHLPSASSRFAQKFERLSLIQHCPFGMFAGMVVFPVPRFGTNPLTVSYGSKQPAGQATSCLFNNFMAP